MENSTHEFKYQKHSEKQYMAILTAAEKLFVENGIEKVNLTDISNECGIMRATLYRYFRNKDELLWHIMRRNSMNFFHKLLERMQTTTGTTYERFKIFLDILYEDFVRDIKFYLFIDLFNNTYQKETSGDSSPLYNEVYGTDDFRSGDTVRFLIGDFHDGTVKECLDPRTTAVTIMYSAISIVAGMSKQINTLPAKYGISPQEVVSISLNTLLDSIKA